jgi:hypothetical protein
MAQIKISCEHCGQHIKCDEGYSGLQINCPNCQQGLSVPTVKGKNPPKKQSHKEIVAEITEANRIDNLAASNLYLCPHCNSECEISSQTKSGALNCPECSNTFYLENHCRFIRKVIKAIFVWTAIAGMLASASAAVYDYASIDELRESVFISLLVFFIVVPILMILAWMITDTLIENYFKTKIASPLNPLPNPTQRKSETPFISKVLDKKNPSNSWAGMGGIALLIIMLFRHWDGVSHFFGSVKTSIGATANSVQSSLASSSIKGCVYATTRNGNAVKMSGIQVFALEETALRKRIQEINGTIQSDFQSSLEKAGVKESDTWFLEEKASWEAGLVNDKILNSGTAGFYSTTTDADGNYSFQGIKTGAYCLIARATREVGNEVEYHLWYCKIPAPTGVDKLGVIWKPDLANYYDLLNSNSFIQDVDRKVSSQDFANKAKQGISDGYWASIMINNYGLNLPVIYR